MDLNKIYIMISIVTAVTILIIIIYSYISKKLRHQKYLKSSLSDLDHLTGEAFEDYLAAIYEVMGYTVKKTPKSHDYGADLILKKNNELTIVQAKRYKGNVGIAAVQQIIGAKAYYKADKCMVVTNQYYTPQAKKLALANNVILKDRNDLYKITKPKQK